MRIEWAAVKASIAFPEFRARLHDLGIWEVEVPKSDVKGKAFAEAKAEKKKRRSGSFFSIIPVHPSRGKEKEEAKDTLERGKRVCPRT